MQNKIDEILKKLINEEIDKTQLIKNRLGWELTDITHSGNFDKVLNSDTETHDFLVKIADVLKQFILDSTDRDSVEYRKAIKLMSLVSDVLNNYEFIYSKNLSTIKNILFSFKELNLI